MSLKKIVVIRHAESQEDVDPNLNRILSDNQISITKNGRSQINVVSSRVLDIISKYKTIRIYSSSSNRAIQTASIIRFKFGMEDSEIITDSRIRNLNWGNTTLDNIEEIKKERYKAGVLHYQFPKGDHSPVFISNIGQFVQELLLMGEKNIFPEAVVIVTHGFALRIIAKFLLKISDYDFRWIKNPTNCYVADFSIDESGGVSIKEPLLIREPV